MYIPHCFSQFHFQVFWNGKEVATFDWTENLYQIHLDLMTDINIDEVKCFDKQCKFIYISIVFCSYKHFPSTFLYCFLLDG